LLLLCKTFLSLLFIRVTVTILDLFRRHIFAVYLLISLQIFPILLPLFDIYFNTCFIYISFIFSSSNVFGRVVSYNFCHYLVHICWFLVW